METITEGHPDFKSFERRIYEIMCCVACGLIRKYLEWRDLSIMGARDTKEYRLVDSRATTIKTVMGEVSFSRRYYKKRSGGYVFLLDEALGLDSGYGLVSENLAEQIVLECTDKSFRKAADSISSLTGQTISAMGAWGVLQRYGEAVRQQVDRLRELDEGGATGQLGNIPSRVIFEEFDDIWLSMQKETRCKPAGKAAAAEPEATGEAAAAEPGQSKKTGKKPLHIGTAYTGWAQEKDGRYSTVNKVAYASFGAVPGFTTDFEALMRHCFDMDGVERRVTNGDGEQWIRTAAELNDSILQLDPYHRGKAIVRAVSDKGARKQLFDAIGEKDVDKTLGIVCGLIAASQDEKAREKLGKLHAYFYNNRDSFLTWQERGIELPAPPEGVEYRTMGTQESSNCDLITQRMKHRKGSWTPKGGNNMAKILCFRHTVGLDAILGHLPEAPPTEAWAGPLSAAKAPQYDGKGYGAEWLYAEMPFEQAFKTNGREAIRGMLRLKPLSQLSFL